MTSSLLMLRPTGQRYFRGYDKAEAKILQERSVFKLVFSVDNALLCMFRQLWTYFQDIGVLKFFFGGYVLSGHCGRQQISVKNDGYLIRRDTKASYYYY